jgi:hypothetical protein
MSRTGSRGLIIGVPAVVLVIVVTAVVVAVRSMSPPAAGDTPTPAAQVTPVAIAQPRDGVVTWYDGAGHPHALNLKAA